MHILIMAVSQMRCKHGIASPDECWKDGNKAKSLELLNGLGGQGIVQERNGHLYTRSEVWNEHKDYEIVFRKFLEWKSLYKDTAAYLHEEATSLRY